MTKFRRIDTQKPDERRVLEAVEILKNDGILVYPTDSVYTMGARINCESALKRICKLKDIKIEKAQFSIVCSDYSHLSGFARQISNVQFKILKDHLPGPFTFILEANKKASTIFKRNKKTIGFRIPDSPLIKEIIQKLKQPIFSASIPIDNNDSAYSADAEDILEEYEDRVDMVIDGGPCGEVPTTIVDLTTEPFKIIRQGSGEFLG